MSVKVKGETEIAGKHRDTTVRYSFSIDWAHEIGSANSVCLVSMSGRRTRELPADKAEAFILERLFHKDDVEAAIKAALRREEDAIRASSEPTAEEYAEGRRRGRY